MAVFTTFIRNLCHTLVAAHSLLSGVQWSTRLLCIMRDPGFNPQGATYVKPRFSC
jgi:hypothetical protein